MHNRKSKQSKNVINPVKTNDNLMDTGFSFDGESEILNMQNEMNTLFMSLMVDNKKFKPEVIFQSLLNYIKIHDRILYSVISNIVYRIVNDDDLRTRETTPDKFGTLISNIEKLLEYVNNATHIAAHKQAKPNDSECIDNTKKAVWKIWDHVHLARNQYNVLRQSDEEYNTKFEAKIEKFQNKITREINTQLLTIVSIFTALSFIL
ncbi:MAG: hypothetical protein IJ667_08920, partial [Synergistaceae bacterium]|nr:hypothetical protein [Synergistaceae bacterium]